MRLGKEKVFDDDLNDDECRKMCVLEILFVMFAFMFFVVAKNRDGTILHLPTDSVE